MLGGWIDRYAVLDLIASLVKKSLITAHQSGPAARYRLLETVRHYALERLGEAEEDAAVRDRHRDFFVALAERAAPHLESALQPCWLEALDAEAANLAGAIDHAIRTDPELALRLCAALFPLWRTRGRFAEAESAYSRSIAAAEGGPSAMRARVLWCRAYIAVWSGDFEAAETHGLAALELAERTGDRSTAARALCTLGLSELYAHPPAARPRLRRAAEFARAAGDDWALIDAQQLLALSYRFQCRTERSIQAADEVAGLAEQLGYPGHLARGCVITAANALLTGRYDVVREAGERALSMVSAVGEPMFSATADAALGILEIHQGATDRALERLRRRLERSIELGTGLAIPTLSTQLAAAELAVGRLDPARDRLEDAIPRMEGRDSFMASRALTLLADTLRLLGDDAAESAAERARAVGDGIGNALTATRARLVLGRLAAADGDWEAAELHALAHLDACVDGGHVLYIPDCLDPLAEVAAGLHSDEDAVCLLAAADRARTELGSVRLLPEPEHWTALEARLRDGLGEQAYDKAWTQAYELTVEEAIAWMRRARGKRKRPPGGWESLTPTEAKVVELVALGLTNPQIGERMFISRATRQGAPRARLPQARRAHPLRADRTRHSTPRLNHQPRLSLRHTVGPLVTNENRVAPRRLSSVLLRRLTKASRRPSGRRQALPPERTQNSRWQPSRVAV